MTRAIFIAAALAFVATLPAIPAQATGVSRTFVSAAGSDSNNCANVATPCRHLAAAYAATAANGEIFVLDPANYGSLTITHAVSIEGHGWASIAPVANGDAITINASPGDKINIIGVVLDGTGLAGATGIRFDSGGTLTVRDSVIRNFAGDGIFFGPPTNFAGNLIELFVSNTMISDNGINGVSIGPQGDGAPFAKAVLDHVQLVGNGNNGVAAFGDVSAPISVLVSNSVSAFNGNNGVLAQGGALDSEMMVQNSSIFENGGNGLFATGINATIFVTKSTIHNNSTQFRFSNGAQLISFGDNSLNAGAGTDGVASVTTTLK